MTETMTIVLNGEPIALPARTSVRGLLELQGIGGRIAVEINGDILARSAYAERELNPGDRVEVVRAIGGGLAP